MSANNPARDDVDTEVEDVLDLPDLDDAPDVEPIDVHDHDEQGAPEA